jgi:hypothetical protein
LDQQQKLAKYLRFPLVQLIAQQIESFWLESEIKAVLLFEQLAHLLDAKCVVRI